jgi:hypothetical protein
MGIVWGQLMRMGYVVYVKSLTGKIYIDSINPNDYVIISIEKVVSIGGKYDFFTQRWC